jgi:hypothetical protein
MERFLEFGEVWGKKYPAIIRLWENAWAEFVPFLAFDPEIRRIICSTNAIVIWSRPEGVLHVVDGGVRSGFLRGGRGYLPWSMTWDLGGWTVPTVVDTGVSCPIRRELQKWVRHAVVSPRNTGPKRLISSSAVVRSPR